MPERERSQRVDTFAQSAATTGRTSPLLSLSAAGPGRRAPTTQLSPPIITFIAPCLYYKHSTSSSALSSLFTFSSATINTNVEQSSCLGETTPSDVRR
uniref:Uncharacterized protein n=1 Tax=Plectus sambesii TaxID=2011161 RepID=A0A914UUV4_9BILA